jgi:proline iminopeptidase
MQDSIYLGDLGGLSRYRRLVILDLRGTGRSDVPADSSTYRCDRQVDDVEALRQHLELEQMDVLGHSAGTNLAALYVARYPHRVSSLTLITPSGGAVGISITSPARLEVAQLRKDEPWFPAAIAALERIAADQNTNDDWGRVAPFFVGRWDAAAQEHAVAADGQTNPEAAEIFWSEGAFAPPVTRAALADFTAPVLLMAGEFDVNSVPSAVAEFAAVFPSATFVVQPEAGHQPWLDDADRFLAALVPFLAR